MEIMVTLKTATDLEAVVSAARGWLLKLDDVTVRHKPSADRWSIAEVVGHMIDSACNNHQRFIRAQELDELTFPKYEQNSWVAKSVYETADWSQLVQFWYLYNLHLAVVIRGIPSDQLSTSCTITPYDPCTLEYLVIDYLDHLNHHLAKIRERVES